MKEESILSLFLKNIYLFLRDRARVGEGQREEGDTESKAGSRLWAVSTELDAGLELTNREIMTWAEVGRLTDWATQAPQSTLFFFLNVYLFLRERERETS